jgi:hypothetical protein
MLMFIEFALYRHKVEQDTASQFTKYFIQIEWSIYLF